MATKCGVILPRYNETSASVFAVVQSELARRGVDSRAISPEDTDSSEAAKVMKWADCFVVDYTATDGGDLDPDFQLLSYEVQDQNKPTLVIRSSSPKGDRSNPPAGEMVTFDPDEDNLAMAFSDAWLKMNAGATTLSRRVRASEIDLDGISPVDFENLCFELLQQSGLTDVRWGQGGAVDLYASTRKRDPDGYSYSESWLVSIVSLDPQALSSELHHLTDSVLEELRRKTPRKSQSVTTLLLIDRFLPRAAQARITRELEKSFDEASEKMVRVRIWSREYLQSLISRRSQLILKYFQDPERLLRHERKGIDELYAENVASAERLQKALADVSAERARRLAAEQDAMWKQLSFVAAHKLGNPIFALETHLRTLERHPGKTETLQPILDEMQSSIEKAKVIVDEFKSLQRANDVEMERVDIVPLIRHACALIEQSSIGTDCELPEEPVYIVTDGESLTQCLDELVRNALRWVSNEGHPSITITLRVGESQPAGGVIITVADNGPGVVAEDKQKIFNPFFTTSAHGTGLGLAIVHSAVTALGGEVWEHGLPGAGAEFSIRLPTDGGINR